MAIARRRVCINDTDSVEFPIKMMTPQVSASQLSIEQIVLEIFSTRRITRTDQRRLMSMLLAKDFLSSQEQNSINRIFESLRQGAIRVVD